MEQTIISNDTIVAVATPHGRGAIAMVRLSGKNALEIADMVWKGAPLTNAKSHSSHLGFIYNPSERENADATPIDQALATIFIGPNSFTGEDLVEFGLHGSPLIARQVLSALVDAGARPAGPGEFSQRAVANGRMSLLSAESAADLVAATSKAAQRIAMTQMRGGVERSLQQMQDKLLQLASLLELELDFSEEDVEFASREELRELALSVKKHLENLSNSFRTGQAIKEGIPVAIVGPTNAGKSSLLNALLNDDRAIVSDIHGTTRDIIEDTLEIGDYLFRFMDTAGLRETEDPIEQIGITQSKRALGRARIVILTTDATLRLPENLVNDTLRSMAPDATLIILRNKTDLVQTNNNPLKPHIPLTQSISLNPLNSLNSLIPLTPLNSLNSLNSLNPLPQTPITLNISAKTNRGIDRLKEILTQIISYEETSTGDILLTNERHYHCVSEALAAIDRVLTQLPSTHTYTLQLPSSKTDSQQQQSSPDTFQLPLTHYPATPDLIAQTVREVISPLAELTGTALQTPTLLQNIFAHFCVGK